MSDKLRFWTTVLILLVGLGLSPKLVSASIIISEVAPAPSSGPEWVEVVNTGEETFDLSNFYLEDVLTTPTVIKTFGHNTQILPGQILVFELENTKLNNSGDGVGLKNPAGTLIDGVIFGSTESNMSWHRQLDINQPLQSDVATPLTIKWWLPPTGALPSVTPTPSTQPIPTLPLNPTPTSPPASASASPSPTTQPVNLIPGSVQLSEVVACADAHGEWVEVVNNLDYALDLNGWYLVDSSNNQRKFETQLPAHGLTVLSWQENMLNNSGDNIRLIDSHHVTQDFLTLPECTAGISYASINHVWQLTNQVSYNQPNLVSLPTASPSPVTINSPSPSPTGLIRSLITTSPIGPIVSPELNPILPSSWFGRYLSDIVWNSEATGSSGDLKPVIKLNQIDAITSDPIRTDTPYPWSDIMGSLMLTVGGFLLTHVRSPFSFPPKVTTFHQR